MSEAQQAVIDELYGTHRPKLNFFGIPIVIDDSLEDDEWYLEIPEFLRRT